MNLYGILNCSVATSHTYTKVHSYIKNQPTDIDTYKDECINMHKQAQVCAKMHTYTGIHIYTPTKLLNLYYEEPLF